MARAANAKEQKFMEAVAEFGLYHLFKLNPEWSGGFQIHHVIGRSGKHNKVHIGHWFILPIPFDLHDVHSNHPLNVTHFRKRFTAEFGNQRDLWLKMVELMDYDVPEEVKNAISDTRY